MTLKIAFVVDNMRRYIVSMLWDDEGGSTIVGRMLERSEDGIDPKL